MARMCSKRREKRAPRAQTKCKRDVQTDRAFTGAIGEYVGNCTGLEASANGAQLDDSRGGRNKAAIIPLKSLQPHRKQGKRADEPC